MIQLVGFAGRAGCGKSYAAKLLVERAGFVRTRFADPLKDMLRVLGLGDAEVDGDRKEAPSPLLCGRTPRWAMQTLGTEWGRAKIGADLWSEAWARRAQASLAFGECVVVDDVRFPNEIALIRSLGGRVFWIDRGLAGPPAHVSEALEPDACHGRIENPGDERFATRVALAALEMEFA